MKLSMFSVVDHYPEGARDLRSLYGEIIDQAVLADRLGFETVWLAEHHFIDYGVVPNPAVMLASLAPRTSRVKLGPAISLVPFRDPRQVAEDYVMLDQLSGGRAVLGVGSGYVKPEFDGFGIPFEEKHARFNEGLDTIVKLIGGERVTLNGRYSRSGAIRLNVSAIQQRMPVFVAVGQRDAMARVGAQGHSVMFMAYTMCNAIGDAAAVVGDYRQARKQAGHIASAGTTAVGMHTHVAATDAEARDAAEEAFARYCSTRLKARKRSYEEAVNDGVVLFGSPQTVADRLVALHRMGVDEFMTLHNFGLIDASVAESSMKRLMQDALPLVRERILAAAA